jgi:hypothetical protein
MEWQCVAGAWVLVNVFAPEVTALPAVPIDQQECVLVADSANGVKYHLRYRAASLSAAKWEVIGGPPLIAAINTSESINNATYGDLATAGPSILPPAAGDYDVSLGANILSGTADHGTMSIALGATPASDNDGVRVTQFSVNPGLPVARSLPAKALAAGATIRAKYRTGGAQTATFSNRWLRVMPVRLGP